MMANTVSTFDLATHPVTVNVMNHYANRADKTDQDRYDFAKLALYLNCTMMERHPDLFSDPKLVMASEETEIEGQPVQAKTHRLRSCWTFAVAGQPETTPEESRKIEQEIIAALVDSAAEEIRADLGAARFCPYVPFFATRITIDPETFEPVIRFDSIYGAL